MSPAQAVALLTVVFLEAVSRRSPQCSPFPLAPQQHCGSFIPSVAAHVTHVSRKRAPQPSPGWGLWGDGPCVRVALGRWSLCEGSPGEMVPHQPWPRRGNFQQLPPPCSQEAAPVTDCSQGKNLFSPREVKPPLLQVVPAGQRSGSTRVGCSCSRISRVKDETGQGWARSPSCDFRSLQALLLTHGKRLTDTQSGKVGNAPGGRV